MLLANKKNLKQYAKDLLGNEYTLEKEKELINICCNKSLKDYHDNYSHISFAINAWLKDINKIMNAFGVESLYPDIPDCEYVNVGDTYNTTILYFKNELRIGCWGDIVEKYIK